MSMLLAVLCALQVGTTTTPAPLSLTVKLGDRVRTVPVVRSPEGAAVIRADLLADGLGAQLTTLGEGRYRLTLGNHRLSFLAGSAWAEGDSSVYPLSVAPYRVAGRLLIPMTLVMDIMPQAFSGLIYDEDRRELRRFALVSAPRAPVTPERRTTIPSRVTTLPLATNLRQRRVVVDAGHGGPDNGMSGPIGAKRKVREKDITLAVATALHAALEKRGVTAVMTRTTDTLIALADRGKIANLAKGDLFISIHVNAANPRWKQPSAARGFETYFLAEAKTEDEKRVEAMENESIRFEGNAETSSDDPLGFIIRDMAQNEHLRESSTLADLIQQQLRTLHPGPSRGVKQAGFRVLVTAFMPSVLVEVGFGSNAAEAAYLSNPARQRELADAIATAAVAYLAQYERKVGRSNPQ